MRNLQRPTLVSNEYMSANNKAMNGFYLAAGLVAVYFYSPSAQAALVSAENAGIMESFGSGTNAITQGQGSITIVLQTLAVLVGASVTLGLGQLIYSSLLKTSTDRAEEAWGNFYKTTIASVVVIVLVDALCISACGIIGSYGTGTGEINVIFID